jgi:hypothetical protein
MVHYCRTISSRVLNRKAWIAIAEATLKYREALDALDVALIEGALSLDVVYESQSVLHPIIGRNKVLSYLSNKFKAVAGSRRPLTLETGLIDLPRAREWPCIIIRQAEDRILIVLSLDDQEKITRIDIVTVAPKTEEARAADLYAPPNLVVD